MMETINLSNGAYEIDIDDALDDDGEMMIFIYDNLEDIETVLFITPDEARSIARTLLAAAGDQEPPSVDETAR